MYSFERRYTVLSPARATSVSLTFRHSRSVVTPPQISATYLMAGTTYVIGERPDFSRQDHGAI